MAAEMMREFWTDPGVVTQPSDAELAMAARSMIAARRALAGHLPIDFIHDTALDVLLALYVASVETRTVTAKTLVSSVSVGRSVMLRWLRALAGEGLIDTGGAVDADPGVVRLTDHGVATISATIAAVIRSQADLYAD